MQEVVSVSIRMSGKSRCKGDLRLLRFISRILKKFTRFSISPDSSFRSMQNQCWITVLKQSHDHNKTVMFWKILTVFEQTLLKSFYNLEPMIYVVCIFVEYQSGAIADTVLKHPHGVSKTDKIFEGNFHCCHRNVVFKLFRIVQRFYGLW